MRALFLTLIAAHGLAHLPGFIGRWRLADLRAMPYHTTAPAGHVDIGDGGMRFGVLNVVILGILAVGQHLAWKRTIV